MTKAPIHVAVTGAAGQIGYALVPRIASGAMFGPDQPVVLQMVEIPDEKAMKALEGVAMELDDCAFPLLQGMVLTSDPVKGFEGANWVLLIGSRPRGPGGLGSLEEGTRAPPDDADRAGAVDGGERV